MNLGRTPSEPAWGPPWAGPLPGLLLSPLTLAFGPVLAFIGVVLGTRGKTGLRELLIGTTAEKIVANAPCSILAVKPEESDGTHE